MKLIFAMSLLSISNLAYSQTKPVFNDLMFSNYKDHPKKVTEVTTTYGTITFREKQILYLDKEGFITKMESYMAFPGGNLDSLGFSGIAIYNNSNKQKRLITTVNQNKEITRTSYIQRLSEYNYQTVSFEKGKLKSTKKYYFNSNANIEKSEVKASLPVSSIDTKVQYFYENGQIKYFLVENKTMNVTGKIYCRNARLDDRGNILHVQYYDEKNELQEEINSVFEYY